MKLTIKKVLEMEPCSEAIEWAKPIWNGKEEDSLVVLKRLIAEEKYDWANWLIVMVMKRKQYLAYAIFSAEQVIDIYEKKYPNDERPRKSIEAAKLVLKHDTKKNREAAWAAGGAEAGAGWAAQAAAWAAEAAAWATQAAARAAQAAEAAAQAAQAAAKKEMQIKILNYGMKMLEEK